MSLRGKLNNEQFNFANAVRRMSMRGVVDSQGGVNGTRKIVGYVCGVHGFDDADESLRGTVDVQEYEYGDEDDTIEGVGLHEGVLCSAIQTNGSGVYMMPLMYSDVMIVQDPVSLDEYVVMYSHVSTIQLQSHESVNVGVTETEDFVEGDSDDLPDYYELQKTGNSSSTEYTKEHILHRVSTPDGDFVIEQKADKLEISASKSTITISADGKVEIKADTVEIKDAQLIMNGQANNDMNGGFNCIPTCPFTGAPHSGSKITSI